MKNRDDLAALIGQPDEKTGKQIRAVIISGDGKARNVVDHEPEERTNGHVIAFNGVRDDGCAEFICTNEGCSLSVGFVMPGEGEPAAVDLGNGDYGPPEHFGDWVDPCTHQT